MVIWLYSKERPQNVKGMVKMVKLIREMDEMETEELLLQLQLLEEKMGEVFMNNLFHKYEGVVYEVAGALDELDFSEEDFQMKYERLRCIECLPPEDQFLRMSEELEELFRLIEEA